MKKLVIIRHAKSSWDDPFLNDHDRPLAERGLKDAPKMAKRLKKEKIHPIEELFFLLMNLWSYKNNSLKQKLQ